MLRLQTDQTREYIALLKRRLKKKTLRHCISATEFMATYTDDLGLSREEVVAAGLLHDLCKNMDYDELVAAAERFGIQLRDAQRTNPGLLHGPVAAEQCRRSLGIQDPDVYEAIYWHTTGKADWCRLGCALYFADFAEPTRTFPEAAQARVVLAEQGFDAALLYAAEEKLVRLRSKRVLDPVTSEFVTWLRDRQGRAHA